MPPRQLRRTAILFVFTVTVAHSAAAQPNQVSDPQIAAALKRGDQPAAIELLSKQLDRRDLPASQLARALYHRAKAHFALRHAAQAAEDAKSALWLGLELDEATEAEALLKQSTLAIDQPPRTIPAAAEAPVRTAPAAWAAARIDREILPETTPTPAVEGTRNIVTGSIATPSPSPPQAPAPPPAAWAAARIDREMLPETTPTPAVEGTRNIVTGSIATPSPSPPHAPAPPPALVTEQAPQVAPPSAPIADVTGAISSLASAVGTGLGAIGQASPSPLQTDLDRAEDQQRRYIERLRRHNEDVAAGKKPSTVE